MRFHSAIALPVLALVVVGCRSRRPQAPAWVLAAPAKCTIGLSGETGWLLEQPQFQELLAKFPLAEQSLDLFLKKARINPHGETGRVSLFTMDLGLEADGRKASTQIPTFLLQFQGFRNPSALQKAIAESFPVEGSLRVKGSDLPLHVVLDMNQYHIRILTDLEGNVWLGDLSSLAGLDHQDRIAAQDPVLGATARIDRTAPLQGFLRPEGMLKDLSNRLSADVVRELPQGIQCLAWSINPSKDASPMFTFEIAISGSPQAIVQSTPWLQRIVAIATSIRTGNAAPPDLLQERTRATLRCQLSWDQVGTVLSKLAQPNLAPRPGKQPAQ